MNATEAVPALAPEQMRRRIDDLPLPARPLDWDDEGTPLDHPSVVYLYHPKGARPVLWMEIKTRENLLDVQAAPDRYELRTLFAASVEDLARSPLSMIASAQIKLDRIRTATGQAIAAARRALNEIASQA